ncbi:MAG: hypothetical protein NZ901_10610 [Geminocystis sp.]|nr:hypothetical protein [Geminocystis sp.]MCS7148627.1 hypothetical protein [Geminocystis sp.]MCX8079401.1 hypothetical protein [Geminocystis sp.]MDW8114981.1 hypothetical protein [Geminocystis sp.]MDW8464249.1 hypothetical protein [Geminocystis sp.]
MNKEANESDNGNHCGMGLETTQTIKFTFLNQKGDNDLAGIIF